MRPSSLSRFLRALLPVTVAAGVLLIGSARRLFPLALAVGLLLAPAVARAGPCPNEALRTGPSAALPDCRAYELVSTGAQSDVDPFAYNGQVVFPGGSTAVPALSGDELLWQSAFATPPSTSGAVSTWSSARQSSSWAQASQPPSPPGVDPSGAYVSVAAATPNLSYVLVGVAPPTEGERNPAPSAASQYVLRNPDGSYTTVATGEEAPGSTSGQLAGKFSEAYVGSRPGALAELSEDGSHVYFEATGQFAGDAHAGGDQLYEWSDGHLQVAALDSAATTCGATLGDMHGGTVLYDGVVPGIVGGALGHIASAVSRDGSRVFLESPDPWAEATTAVRGRCPPTDLYLREDDQTIDISAPPPGVADRGDARFVGATPDGSRVFFTTPTQLTASKTNTGPDLYEYDVETGALTRLSVGPPGHDDANVQSAVASSDGSHVYFIATGQLVPPEGAPGQPNLYVYENGAVRFIATVSPNLDLDNETGSVGQGLSDQSLGYAEGDAAFLTPSGEDLVFEDTLRLTAYNNTYNSEGVDEIYRYDAPSGQISCVSCNPAGTPPEPPTTHGRPNVSDSTLLGGFAPFNGPNSVLWNAPSTHLRQRVISDDGRMVFFTSSEALLPGANRSENVYEWNDGSLSLISSGRSPLPSQLLGASASGSDVFFTTFAPLVSEDAGQFDEIYDARVDGGFPVPSSPAPCGSVEACRGAPASSPLAAPAPTATFSGPGNPIAPAPSTTEPAEASKPKALTRAQELAKALKACEKDKSRSKRLACERSARLRYGPPHKAQRKR